MRVALTGATGFIGSHILAELQGHGHEVTALVRDDAQAGTVAEGGATPAVVDLYDRPTVVSLLRATRTGLIHTASPGDETSANLDAAVVDAAIAASTGTGRPYLHISGTWIYGDNDHITEGSSLSAPALVSWKEPIDLRVLEAKDMRGVVIVAGLAYGDGGEAIPGFPLSSPRDDAGNLIMLGTAGGSTGRRSTSPTSRTSSDASWKTTRPAASTSSAMERIRPSPRSPRRSRSRPSRKGPRARTRRPWARLGDYLAEVLLLDQSADAARARTELDWHPAHPGLVDELRNGSYRNGKEKVR